jgi:DNA (cytosine-5)-methyltransferase 1
VQRFFRLVPEGKNWRSLPARLQRIALGGSWEAGGGKTGFYRRLAWGRPSPTITGRANSKGSALCHPEDDRPLSVRECAAIQGFPNDWKFFGAMNTQYMQVGNAVPVNLGSAIGKAFAEFHPPGHRRTTTDSLDAMLEAATARLRAAARNHSARPAQLSCVP